MRLPFPRRNQPGAEPLTPHLGKGGVGGGEERSQYTVIASTPPTPPSQGGSDGYQNDNRCPSIVATASSNRNRSPFCRLETFVPLARKLRRAPTALPPAPRTVPLVVNSGGVCQGGCGNELSQSISPLTFRTKKFVSVSVAPKGNKGSPAETNGDARPALPRTQKTPSTGCLLLSDSHHRGERRRRIFRPQRTDSYGGLLA